MSTFTNQFLRFALLFLFCINTEVFSQTTITFNYVGGMQTYTVPSGVTSIIANVRGAQGGSGVGSTAAPGGTGGSVQGTISVAPGTVLYLFVGSAGTPYSGGYNGGGNNSAAGGGGGGGASDIRIGGTALSNRVIVAGGGGGGGGGGTAGSSYSGGYPGGKGGNTTGESGSPIGTMGGGGGTSSGPGTPGGTGYYGGTGFSGAIGALGLGGNGSGTFSFGGSGGYSGGSGGGGGGFMGGSSGGVNYAPASNGAGGGGGGSSSISTSVVSGAVMTQGGTGGNGAITIIVPTPPAATTTSATAITTSTVTLHGLISDNGATTTVIFDHSTSSSLTSGVTSISGTPASVSAGTGSTAVSASLSGLIPNTTYYYRVKGTSSVGVTDGSILSFTTLNIAPSVTTLPATAITTTSATLNGLVNDNGAITTVSLDYSTSPALTTGVTTLSGIPASIPAGTGSTAITVALGGLTPGTTYYYRVKGINSGGVTSGSILSFISLNTAPSAVTISATGISTNLATLNGLVNDNGSTTAVNFDYSTSSTLTTGIITVGSIPASVTAGMGSTAVATTLGSLTPGTIYYYRVKGTNSGGTTSGSILSFTTLNSPPSATTLSASGITANTATLNGLVNDDGATTTVSFDYGTSPTLSTGAINISGIPGSVGAGAGSTAIVATLTGLSAATTYYYRVKGISSGGTTSGAILSFTTANNLPTAITQAAIAITANSAVMIGLGNDNGTTATISFDYSMSPTLISGVTNISGSPASIAAGTGNTAVAATLSGLITNTTYYYRVTATSAAGTTIGSILNFTTLAGSSTNVSSQQNIGNDIKIFPNPAASILHVESPVEVNVSVNGLDGKVIIRNSEETDIDVSRIADGAYFIIFTDKKGAFLKMEKLLKSTNNN